MIEETLFPESVSAYRLGSFEAVLIVAKGHEDGFCDIHIGTSPSEIFPPTYEVKGTPCAVIGLFPYTVCTVAILPDTVEYIRFRFEDGVREIPITDYFESEAKTPKALLDAAQAKDDKNRAVGFAANTVNVDKAFSNAIATLRSQNPDLKSINAVITETGFAAAGSPIGIAMTYVAVVLDQG